MWNTEYFVELDSIFKMHLSNYTIPGFESYQKIVSSQIKKFWIVQRLMWLKLFNKVKSQHMKFDVEYLKDSRLQNFYFLNC